MQQDRLFPQDSFFVRYRHILRPVLALLAALLIGWLLIQVLDARVRNPQQHLVTALWLGSVYSLFALGYALVFSILGLLNLSHSAVFMWGAFIGLSAVLDWGLPLWVALPAGMIGGGIIGVVVDVVAFAPLRRRNAPRIAQLISSIGAAAVLVNLAQLQFGTQPQRFPRPELETLPFQATQARLYEWNILGQQLDFRVSPLQIAIFVTALLMMLALQFLIARTKTGKAMRTVAFNQRIASLLSINVGNIYRFTFFLAGALAGAAGVLYGLAYNSMVPFMGEEVALKGLTVIVLGGMGSIRGAVAGGFVVAAVEVYAVAIGYSWMKEATVFVALFLILLIRPQGLLGEAQIKRA